MSIQDVGSIGELIAAIATVLTLVYLAIQVRHNSRALDRSNEFAQANSIHHLTILFNELNWGLIIYDEVHLLPAPIFRITSEIQARRRLGLTASDLRAIGWC